MLNGKMQQAKHSAVLGILDNIGQGENINMAAMVKEHFAVPEHFPIHVSKLKILKPDRVADRPRKKSIISDIF